MQKKARNYLQIYQERSIKKIRRGSVGSSEAIYIVRHGETDWNKKKLVKKGIFPLNEYGRHLALETSYGMRQLGLIWLIQVPYGVQKKRQRFLKDATSA